MGDHFDHRAAARFVGNARSRFCQIAVDWLVAWDDPVDILMTLSRDTADSFGPWETYRFCSLLGLSPSGAVKDLALDVLAEPPNPRDNSAPLEHAAALAHAMRALPGEDAPFARSILDHLNRTKDPAIRVMVCATALPLAIMLREVIIDDALIEDYRDQLANVLESAAADGSALTVPVLEAAKLAQDADLIATGERALGASQLEDGSLMSEHQHPTLRALVTLRGLCLVRERFRDV